VALHTLFRPNLDVSLTTRHSDAPTLSPSFVGDTCDGSQP
jgi:hypothetical protein